MLSDYDISHFNVSDKYLAKPLLFNILCRTDKTNVMEDTIQLISIYNNLSFDSAYVTRICYLFESGLIERGINLLKYGKECIDKKFQQKLHPGIENPHLDVSSIFQISKEIIYFIIESMDDIVSFVDVDDEFEELKGRFERLARSAVELTSLLITSLTEECQKDELLFSSASIELGEVSENKPGDESPLTVYRMNKIFKSMLSLSHQHMFMLRFNEIVNIPICKTVIRQFSRVYLKDNHKDLKTTLTWNILKNTVEKMSCLELDTKFGSDTARPPNTKNYSLNDFVTMICPSIYRYIYKIICGHNLISFYTFGVKSTFIRSFMVSFFGDITFECL